MRRRETQSEKRPLEASQDAEVRTVARDVDILSRCLSIDLEVDPKRARKFAFAAMPDGEAEGLVHRKGDVNAALEKLDLFSAGFAHVIGHNILRHDLPHLMAVSPRFAKRAEAPIDTPWLNPLAFPLSP
ncbi:hypothetical protein [uncultured Maritimibacter sp.]|jgi:ATP-dependent DNA helicase RecQ|uniref:hypothetical protein n=1 Tax=uncultured Maritimibacter sp. TaxID=991866 RepID=UPI00262884DC|nr:hypothetical protein [uncultured Maritimibacter sp.]